MAGRAGRWPDVLRYLLALAPFVALVVVIAQRTWLPTLDQAIMTARTADVFGGDRPLVGAASRYQFNHPGPIQYYAMALPFRLSGGDPRALLWTVTVIQGACAVGALGLLRRYGGRLGLLFGTLAVVVLFHSFGAAVVADPWNPYAPLFPMLLFLVACWAILCGSRWSIPVALATGSYAIESHVGFAVPVVGLGALTVVLLAGQAFQRHRTASSDSASRSSSRRWPVTVVSVTTVVAMWAAPLWDQFFGDHNLTKLWDYFTGGTTNPIGYSQAAGVLGRELSPVGPWISGGPEPLTLLESVVPSSPVWALVLLVAVAAVSAVRFRRRGWDNLSWLGVVTFVSCLLTFVSVAHISDLVFTYLVRWTWIVVALSWAYVAWAVTDLVLAVRRRWTRPSRACSSPPSRP